MCATPVCVNVYRLRHIISGNDTPPHARILSWSKPSSRQRTPPYRVIAKIICREDNHKVYTIHNRISKWDISIIQRSSSVRNYAITIVARKALEHAHKALERARLLNSRRRSDEALKIFRWHLTISRPAHLLFRRPRENPELASALRGNCRVQLYRREIIRVISVVAVSPQRAAITADG